MSNMNGLTWEKWQEYLSKEQDLPRDLRFPSRPDSPSFRLLSRTVRAMDQLSDDYQEACLPVTLALLGIDEAGVIYIAESRSSKGRSLNSKTNLTATWLDGFTAGALYNANQHTLTPPRNDDEFRCAASIWTGPGHQSRHRCNRTDPHALDEDEHWVTEVVHEWTGAESYGDER